MLELQLNLRSLFNIANDIELAFDPEQPYSNRYNYLNALCDDQIEKLRVLNIQIENFRRQNDMVQIQDISANGNVYRYQSQFEVAFVEYIGNCMNIINRRKEELRTSIINASSQQNVSLTHSKNLIVENSIYYIITTGWQTLVPMTEKYMINQIDEL